MRNDLRLGALHAIAAALAFSLMGVCIKVAAAETNNAVIVFVRCAVSLLILLPWLTRRGGLGIRTTRLSGHLWRAGFGILAMYAFFYAIAKLPLAEAMLLTYSTPLWIPFIGWAWIGERPAPVVYPSVVLGLIGVALIVKPGFADIDPVAGAVGAASGVMAACAMVSIRRISDTEPPARIVFYFALLGTTIAAIPLLWAWETPSPKLMLWLLGAGLLATAGQMQLTRAYACAPAALIGPFTYFAVIFSGLLAWAVWQERPDRWSMIGALLVMATCVLVSTLSKPRVARTG
ncbi:EamA/RhaT family transporter [Sinimarinibacterium sp. CAU 1509]|uniref:DMT family transporter n=1 Tax=Sinimarinibacterium sp. CAU 1509 TaxID=2562283 RepID=UPI0010ADA213|nr:EamA family transporter [Sinimarinibacterium sp. CAU 1509]TJY60884.1 EamA/RhaT family transporter [Sinimarinibacterium sp. CAU 1509]